MWADCVNNGSIVIWAWFELCIFVSNAWSSRVPKWTTYDPLTHCLWWSCVESGAWINKAAVGVLSSLFKILCCQCSPRRFDRNASIQFLPEIILLEKHCWLKWHLIMQKYLRLWHLLSFVLISFSGLASHHDIPLNDIIRGWTWCLRLWSENISKLLPESKHTLSLPINLRYFELRHRFLWRVLRWTWNSLPLLNYIFVDETLLSSEFPLLRCGLARSAVIGKPWGLMRVVFGWSWV